MSYPRKRAPIACAYCRQRKRRCDGLRPACSTCIEVRADCLYQDLPSQPLEGPAVVASVVSRMDRIESLLSSQAQDIATLLRGQLSQHSTMGSAPLSVSETMSSPTVTNFALDSHPARYEINESTDLPPLTIPPKHRTSTNRLLALPQVTSLIGEFPEDYFYQVEARRPFPPGLDFKQWNPIEHSFPHLDRRATDRLVVLFFDEIHTCHPILDRALFSSIYEGVLEKGLQFDIESALCLVVLALGECASQPDSDFYGSDWSPGSQYFLPAHSILNSDQAWPFLSGVILTQAFVLGGIYFAYLTMPLHSWRLIHSASTNVQMLLSRLEFALAYDWSIHSDEANSAKTSNDESQQEQILRTCWSCFVMECDRLAEFDLPRSGIEPLADGLTFPSCGNPPDANVLCYLAEISIRGLLNRVHNSLYHAGKPRFFNSNSSTGSLMTASTVDMPVSSMMSICSELNRQLETWYQSIPELVRPPLGVDPLQDERQKILRIRFYAARHIIYRPFVLHVLANPDEVPSALILENCQKCLESCRLYIQNTGSVLKRPSQYTWTISQNSLGAVVVLTVASLSTFLKHLIPDVQELQDLVRLNVSKWATPESSFDAVIWILKDIKRKQQFY